MHDDLDLMQLARGGQLLATVDDTEYRRVAVVFAWPAGGVPAVYCAESDWSASTAARLAEKDREIAQLESTLGRQAAESLKQAQRAISAEARVAELELRLAERPAPVMETPAQNQAKMFTKQAAALHDIGPCPDCGKTGWKNAHALDVHRGRAHQGMQTVKAPPAQFVEELGWHCAAKGCAGAHARSMTDPAFCTLHATRQITNGVEAHDG